MEYIPDIRKSNFLDKAVPLRKGQAAHTPAQEQGETSSPQAVDKVTVAPMKEWLSILEEMPEPEMDESILAEVRARQDSGFYEKMFDTEVFPLIMDELANGWGLRFEDRH